MAELRGAERPYVEILRYNVISAVEACVGIAGHCGDDGVADVDGSYVCSDRRGGRRRYDGFFAVCVVPVPILARVCWARAR